MSISIMTEVWKIERLSSSQKLVFLSLADNANDRGECYPSMRQISARTCLSERAVRDAVRALESLGYVKSVSRLGTSTMYHLSTTPANAAAPAVDAPRQEMPPTPAPIAAPPRQEMPPTPASAAPKPSINRQLNHQLTVSKDLPGWVPEQSWSDWEKFRGKKFTAKAKELSLQTLGKLKDEGHDPKAVIEQSIERGWTGLFPLKTNMNAGATRHGNFAKQDYRAGVAADGSF